MRDKDNLDSDLQVRKPDLKRGIATCIFWSSLSLIKINKGKENVKI